VASSASAPPSPWTDWCFGAGFTDLEDATGDAQQAGTDVSDGNMSAVASDGATLAQAALAAEKNPPPGTSTQKFDYAAYWASMGLSGLQLEAGNLTNATSDIKNAEKYLPAAQAANARCAVMGAG
jgi:hypothetical protein